MTYFSDVSVLFEAGRLRKQQMHHLSFFSKLFLIFFASTVQDFDQTWLFKDCVYTE